MAECSRGGIRIELNEAGLRQGNAARKGIQPDKSSHPPGSNWWLECPPNGCLAVAMSPARRKLATHTHRYIDPESCRDLQSASTNIHIHHEKPCYYYVDVATIHIATTQVHLTHWKTARRVVKITPGNGPPGVAWVKPGSDLTQAQSLRNSRPGPGPGQHWR